MTTKLQGFGALKKAESDPATEGKPASDSGGVGEAEAWNKETTDTEGESDPAKTIGDTGFDAPTVGEDGQALPGSDGNAAVDSQAKRETDEKIDELDERLDRSEKLEPIESQTYQGAKSDPSAADLGLDGDVEKNPVEEVLAESAAATAGHTTVEGVDTIYSCHPIQNLQLGAYHFEGTVLKLASDQVADFESLLEKLPMAERMNITKLNVDRVDQIVQSRQSAATQQFDSSTGREALQELTKRFPRVGTVPIDGPTAHANVSQTDNNMEIPIGDLK